MKSELTPVVDDVRLECVLIQAWKKTTTYLRYHSWYADTLGIDYQSLRIPHFIAEIQDALKNPEEWHPDPIHLVPAPKTQRWGFRNDEWQPRQNQDIAKKLRPLAHMSLRDQVVATALLLCLADRVETTLGDPRLPTDDSDNRRRVLAYGHRLYCDCSRDQQLQHRWGSAKLYRQYFHDYQTWLARPKVVAESLAGQNSNCEIAILHSALSKFYDRVSPNLLAQQLWQFRRSDEEGTFFELARRVLDWRWSDERRAKKYEALQGIPDFGLVALPQGLVASGFFANIAIHRFENALRDALGQQIQEDPRIVLEDACYYVDDLRLVLRIPQGLDEEAVK